MKSEPRYRAGIPNIHDFDFVGREVRSGPACKASQSLTRRPPDSYRIKFVHNGEVTSVYMFHFQNSGCLHWNSSIQLQFGQYLSPTNYFPDAYVDDPVSMTSY